MLEYFLPNYNILRNHFIKIAHDDILTFMKRRAKQTNKQTNKATNFIGWAGVVLLFVNYVLLAVGLIDANYPPYHILSLTGCICIAFEAQRKKDYQPAVLNTLLAFFAIVAIFRIVLNS